MRGKRELKEINAYLKFLFQINNPCPDNLVRHGAIVKVIIEHKSLNSRMVTFNRNMWLCCTLCKPQMLLSLPIKLLWDSNSWWNSCSCSFIYQTKMSNLIRWKKEVGSQFQKHVSNTYAWAKWSAAPLSTICSGQGLAVHNAWQELSWCLGDSEPGWKCFAGLKSYWVQQLASNRLAPLIGIIDKESLKFLLEHYSKNA